jgi:hypothetical protein
MEWVGVLRFHDFSSFSSPPKRGSPRVEMIFLFLFLFFGDERESNCGMSGFSDILNSNFVPEAPSVWNRGEDTDGLDGIH